MHIMQKLHLTLKQSRIMAVFLLITHIGAVVCTVLAINNHFYQIAIAFFCFISLWQNLAKYAWLKNKHSIVEMTLEEDRNWILKLRNETTITVTLEKDSIITAHFALLNFVSTNENGKKYRFHVPICYDNIGQNELRYLRCSCQNISKSSCHDT